MFKRFIASLAIAATVVIGYGFVGNTQTAEASYYPVGYSVSRTTHYQYYPQYYRYRYPTTSYYRYTQPRYYQSYPRYNNYYNNYRSSNYYRSNYYY